MSRARQKPGPKTTGKASGRDSGLIWERMRGRSRGSRAGLSRDRIIEAALAIADAEGLEGVTMRRVAAGLGSSAMSLYRHIQSKDDLMDLMLDKVFGEIPLPEAPSAEWRAELRMLGRQTRVVFKRHSWLSTLLHTRPTLGPKYLRWFEYSLAALAPIGLDIRRTTQMVGAFYAYVRGVVGYELAEEENTRRTGVTEDDKRSYATPYLAEILQGGDYPNFARFFREGVTLDPEECFDFGLDCLLDGFSTRVRQA